MVHMFWQILPRYSVWSKAGNCWDVVRQEKAGLLVLRNGKFVWFEFSEIVYFTIKILVKGVNIKAPFYFYGRWHCFANLQDNVSQALSKANLIFLSGSASKYPYIIKLVLFKRKQKFITYTEVKNSAGLSWGLVVNQSVM